MTPDQLLFLGILLATIVLFVWGKWGTDLVALGSLMGCVLAGLVSPAEAFVGFGHPAVITVGCVLVLSRALQTSGAIDAMLRRMIPSHTGPTRTIAALSAIAALLSSCMNNVGALALLMPVAIQIAARHKMPPGRVLMPVAFGSILGGMTTLIGTPPNLIVSGFREASGAGAFGMFDFTPVGLAVATVGVLFISLVGWRLVPKRERAGVEGFDTGAYLAEARVTENSKSVGKTLREIGPLLEESDAQIVGMVRNDYRVTVPYPGRRLRPGDILVVEAEPSRLASALNALGLSLVDDMRDVDEQRSPSGKASEKAERTLEPPRDKSSDKKKSESDEVVLMELAVRPDADLIGRSATDIRLRSRFGVNLLAFSRQGHRSVRRLRSEAFRAGDVLLLQGPPEFISAFASEYGCVPLADRPIRIPARREAVLSISIMAASVGSAAIGLAPAAVCFALGVFVSMVLRVMPRRKAYEAIDWPVIILLGALMPVATAMETTGTASLIANGLLTHLAGGNAVIALVLILVVTMTLSDVMNNAATAAVMCPVALGAAAQLGVNSDTLLMAVAVGSSCAFLTPIGHQNNVLILGPGGLRFGDYWRLGLPLELIVVATSIPLLLIFWPL